MSVSPQQSPRQRGRGWIVVLVVAAVVLAVAVPVAVISLTRGGGTAPTPGASSSTVLTSPPTTSPTPSTSSAAPSTTTPGPVVVGRVDLDLDTAPADLPPGILYAFDGLIHTADGTTPVPLKKTDQLWSFAPHADGWIVAGYRPKIEDGIARVVDGTGYVAAEWLTAYTTFAMGWDGSTGYAVLDAAQVDGPDGVLVQGWALPVRGEYRLAGILPDQSLVLNDTKRQRVFVGAPQTALARVTGIVAVVGVSPSGQVSTIDSLQDAGSCSSVRESLEADPAWSTCDYSLGRFNPAGSLLIGHPAYQDGLGDWRVSILDAATGTPYVDFVADTQNGMFINTAVWEDDAHLLAQVYSPHIGWKILRLGVDGTVTAAELPVTGNDELEPPVVFVAQP